MGSGTQKLTSYTSIQSNLLHLPLIIHTVGAHTQPEHSSLSTTWSQPSALISLPPQIPHTYLCPSQTGCECFLNHAPASLTSMPSLKLLSEMPSFSISICQNSISPHGSFQSMHSYSLFPGTYNCMYPFPRQSSVALGFCCCFGTCFNPYVVGIGEFVWSCLLSGTVWGQELCYPHSVCLMVPGTGLVSRSYCLWIVLRTVLHMENISAMINKRDILLQNIREPMQAWAFICKVHYCDMQHFSSQR